MINNNGSEIFKINISMNLTLLSCYWKNIKWGTDGRGTLMFLFKSPITSQSLAKHVYEHAI